jgi:hypothetical protein
VAVVADRQPSRPSHAPANIGGHSEFDSYASKLLGAVYSSPELNRGSFPPNGELLSPTMQEWTKSPPLDTSYEPAQRHEMQTRSSMAKPPAFEPEEEAHGSIQAIELVSRSSPKGGPFIAAYNNAATAIQPRTTSTRTATWSPPSPLSSLSFGSAKRYTARSPSTTKIRGSYGCVGCPQNEPMV